MTQAVARPAYSLRLKIFLACVMLAGMAAPMVLGTERAMAWIALFGVVCFLLPHKDAEWKRMPLFLRVLLRGGGFAACVWIAASYFFR